MSKNFIPIPLQTALRSTKFSIAVNTALRRIVPTTIYCSYLTTRTFVRHCQNSVTLSMIAGRCESVSSTDLISIRLGTLRIVADSLSREKPQAMNALISPLSKLRILLPCHHMLVATYVAVLTFLKYYVINHGVLNSSSLKENMVISVLARMTAKRLCKKLSKCRPDRRQSVIMAILSARLHSVITTSSNLSNLLPFLTPEVVFVPSSASRFGYNKIPHYLVQSAFEGVFNQVSEKFRKLKSLGFPFNFKDFLYSNFFRPFVLDLVKGISFPKVLL